MTLMVIILLLEYFLIYENDSMPIVTLETARFTLVYTYCIICGFAKRTT